MWPSGSDGSRESGGPCESDEPCGSGGPRGSRESGGSCWSGGPRGSHGSRESGGLRWSGVWGPCVWCAPWVWWAKAPKARRLYILGLYMRLCSVHTPDNPLLISSDRSSCSDDGLLLVHWSIGPLYHWSIGPLVHCTIGPLVHWSIGPLVRWSS